MTIDSPIITGSIQSPLNLTSNISASGAITGSGFFTTGSIVVMGNITASSARFSNIVTAQTLVVQVVSSSTEYASGSNIFGNLASNTHQFTGSVNITGSSHTIFGNLGIGIAGGTNEVFEIFAPEIAGTSQQVKLRLSQAASISSRVNLISGVISGSNPYFAIEARQALTPFAIVERLRIDGSGNVAIGNTNPQANLHIGPSFNTVPASTSIAVAGDTSIRFMAGSDGNANYGSFIAGTQIAGVRALSLGYRQGAGDITTMTITQLSSGITSGSVGIGIASPRTQLNVQVGGPSIYSGGGAGESIRVSSGTTNAWMSCEYNGATAYFGAITDNHVKFAGYNYSSSAAIDMEIGQAAMYVKANGNVLIGTSTDNSYKLAVGSGTQYLGAGFVVNNDFTSTGRQCATAVSDFSGTTCTFDLASIFPRVTFLNRGLCVTMQLIAIPTYTIASGGFVVLTRTGNSNVWSNSILANININGVAINSVSASGTVITVVYSTTISGTAYINVATAG